VASEEIRFDDWGIDVVLTASQKGLGTPPGLSILVASQQAIRVRRFGKLNTHKMLIFPLSQEFRDT
jgi:aspartate aminotransferase-like enzyme